jgi:uncharacterized protein
MEVLRFDFNGTSGEFKRTPQGFLRVNARLTKTGIFSYEKTREYRSDDEIFRADSMASLQGAPVTDLHPSEKGSDSFLTPMNVKEHIIGMTESVERDGPYLKGSLIIFHEDAIKAIENGERQEISLGYTCCLEPTSGSINGEPYDAIQKDIVVNHVALGPKGWGRAGPDCAIRKDSNSLNQNQGLPHMTETIRLDGVEIPLTKDSMTALLAEKRCQFEELKGRFDAMSLELARAQAEKTALEDPKAIDAKVRSRIALVEQCRSILGNDTILDGKSDEELKLLAIKHRYPQSDLENKDQVYLEGMFTAILASLAERNDSLTTMRHAIQHNETKKANAIYEQWLEHSAKLWTIPLTGSAR